MRFVDRTDAGLRLAQQLRAIDLPDGLLVLGLPRGGVPVAVQVADALDASLDVLVVRKLGVPGHEELAFGAIAGSGLRVLNDDIVRQSGISRDEIDSVTASETQELRRRERAYRGDRGPLDVEGRAVVVVDDGLATGATMAAAVDSLRAAGAVDVTVAVPVGAPSTCAALEERADRVVCLTQPQHLGAVGLWYDDFTPTTDDEVRSALA